MGLLSDVLTIQATPTDFTEISDFILNHIKDKEGVKYVVDTVGNIYVTKGEAEFYPAFCCHTDTSKIKTEGFKVIRLPKNIWVGYKMSNGSPLGYSISGEKVGIFLCLKLIEQLKEIKVVFLSQQKNNYEGAKTVAMPFFDNCKFLIDFDRKGNTDIVTKYGEVELASPEFEELLKTLGKKYGYTVTCATYSDIPYLKEHRKLGISAANLSGGFWATGTCWEQVSEADILNVLAFAKDIALKAEKPFMHQYKKKVGRICQGKNMVTGESCKNLIQINSLYLCAFCNFEYRNRNKGKCSSCNYNSLTTEKNLLDGKCTICTNKLLPGSRVAEVGAPIIH